MKTDRICVRIDRNDPVALLEQRRIDAGATRAQLCRIANIHRSTYMRWIEGSVPKEPTFAKIIDALVLVEQKRIS